MPDNTAIYEYRRYQAAPGKLPALSARFENSTLRFWAKHGIRCIGFWESVVGDSNQLHYILEWRDMGERQRIWDAFQADPEWQAARTASEKDGPLVAVVHNEIWRPTRYSPRTAAP